MEKNINITFKEIVKNCEELKLRYTESLTPFFNIKKIRLWKSAIYSLKMEEWKKDRIWEYLNGDIDIEVLKKLTN